MSRKTLLGVDTGGTFTDFAVVDPQSGVLTVEKVPTTPNEPALAIMNGIEALRREHDVALADVGNLVHATTLVTNALIERYRAQGPTCPLAALMSQVGSVPGAAEVASTLLESWTSEVERGIRTMQAKGQVGASLDAHRTAAAFIAGIQGGVTVLRSTGSTAHLESILAILISYLRDSAR